MSGNTAPDRRVVDTYLQDRIVDLEMKVSQLEARLHSLDQKYRAGREERTALKAMLKAYRTTLQEANAKLSGPGSLSAVRDQVQVADNESDSDATVVLELTSDSE